MNPQPNIPLLRKMVEWAEWQELLPENDPHREWNQSWWISQSECGAAYCIAGKAAIEAGWSAEDGTWSGIVSKDGRLAHIQEAGRDALGISEIEAVWLFASTNTAKDIRTMAERIAGEPL